VKTVEIKNFVGNSPMEVSGYISQDGHGPLITVGQYAESLRFHHAMRPEQAREMAAALIAAADELEAVMVAA